jgi:hypothetical protein
VLACGALERTKGGSIDNTGCEVHDCVPQDTTLVDRVLLLWVVGKTLQGLRLSCVGSTGGGGFGLGFWF